MIRRSSRTVEEGTRPVNERASILYIPVDKYVAWLVPRASWTNAILVVASLFLLAYFGVAAAIGLTSRYFADDFSAANIVRQIGPLETVRLSFDTWQGRYAASFVAAIAYWLTPGVSWYIPEIILALWACGSWGVTGVLLRQGVIPRSLRLLFALMPIYVTLLLVIKPFEPLYWQSGSCNYGLPVALLFCQASIMLSMVLDDMTRKQFYWRLPLVAVLASLLSGFVELIAPIQVALYAAGLLLSALGDRTKLRQRLIAFGVPLFAAAIGMFFLVHAPGIAYRALHYAPRPHGMHLVALTQTFMGKFLVRYIWLEEFRLIPVLIISAVGASADWRRPLLRSAGIALLTALSIAAFALLLIFGCYLLTTYATGGPPYYRTTYIPVAVLATAVVAFGVSIGRFLKTAYRLIPAVVRKWTTPPAILLIASVLSGIVESIPSQVAYKQTEYEGDLDFARQWDTNDALLKSKRGSALVRVPANQFVGWHINDDRDNGVNIAVANYYHLGAIETVGKESVTDSHE